MSKTVIALPQNTLEIVGGMLQDIINSAQIMQKDIFEENVTNDNLTEHLRALGGCEKWLWEELLNLIHQDTVDENGGSENSLMEILQDMIEKLPENQQKILREALD